MTPILFVKTYAKDADKLSRLVKSLREDNFYQCFDRCVFLTEAVDEKPIRCIVREIANSHVATVEACCPEAMGIESGYARQQYLKLAFPAWAPLSRPDNIFYITDSDCWFKPHAFAPAMMQSGVPVMNVAKLVHAGRFNISWREAATATREILKLGVDPTYDYTAYPFWAIIPEYARTFQKHLTELYDGRAMWSTFQELWAGGVRFSEFNLFGEFMYWHHPDAYIFNDIMDPPEGYTAPFVWYKFIAHKHVAPERLTA